MNGIAPGATRTAALAKVLTPEVEAKMLELIADSAAKAAPNHRMLGIAHDFAKRVRVNSVVLGMVIPPGYAEAVIDKRLEVGAAEGAKAEAAREEQLELVDEGDDVQVAALGGTIKQVSIMSTTVTTPDNQVITIPNSKVWGDVVTNVTASDTHRVDLVFGISYGDLIERAQAVLEEVVANHPLVLEDPAPTIRGSELADSSVNFIVRPWTKTSDYWTVYWDLHRAVKEAFDANGISIPSPQTDMQLHVADNRKAAGAATQKALTRDETERPGRTTSYASGDEAAEEPGDGDGGTERG